MALPLVTRILHRVGRRGASLLFLALLDLVYSVSLFALPAESRANPTFLFLIRLMPIWVWAAIWGAVGVACLVQAFMYSDRIAFAAASALKICFGLVYLLGFAVGEVPRGYVSAGIWLAFGGWVMIISTWPEAGRRQP
jgi:hypothetical protein